MFNSGFSHPVGMGRSVENTMTPRFSHLVGMHPYEMQVLGGDTIFYRAVIPTGLIFTSIGLI